MAFWNSSSSSSSSLGQTDSSSTSSPASLRSQQIKQDLQNQISQELAAANATELVRTITENCFDKCILILKILYRQQNYNVFLNVEKNI